MGGLEGERISHDFPGAFPRSSNCDSEGAGRARHGDDFIGLDPRCCPAPLLDDGVRGAEPDVSDLVREMDEGPDEKRCCSYVAQIEEQIKAEAKMPEVKQEPDEVGGETDGWTKVGDETGTREEAETEDDSEFLVSSFVTVALPNHMSKLHMAARDSTPLTQAVPRCRANGRFSHLDAGEELDAKMELCRRCFGLRERGACRRLCEFRVTDPEGTVRRCGRPCAELQEGHDSHSCLLHRLD